MLLHHGWPLLLLLLLLLILRMMQCLYKLLLLLQRRSTIVTPSTRRGTHAQRVLAVRQSNPILHNPAQRIARHFGKSFRRKVYVLKLRKETSISYQKEVTEYTPRRNTLARSPCAGNKACDSQDEKRRPRGEHPRGDRPGTHSEAATSADFPHTGC